MDRLGVNTIDTTIAPRIRHHSPKAYAAIGVGLWILWAGLFILRSPGGAFNHDVWGHIEHTRILYNDRRLALPREGWETYQPPLYYLINCMFSPDDEHHVFRIRLLSVMYGGLTLLLMIVLLSACKVPPEAQAITLGFVATTPAFLFLFTTYNNDSLATLLSVSILVTAYEWILYQRRWQLILLVLLSTAGLYTKISVAYPLASLLCVLGFLGWARKLTLKQILPVVGALAFSVLLWTPWVIGHNYRHTGKLFPTSADTYKNDLLLLPSTPLRTLLTPPGWSKGEWKDPYVHLWETTNHKKNSYVAYLFASSIYGEYTFEFLPPVVPWAILILHAFLSIMAIVRARTSAYGRLSLAFIILGSIFLISLIFQISNSNLMDFRYIAWLWLPCAVLYATTLLSFSTIRPPPLVGFFRVMMMSGILLHAVLWFALIGLGRWNIP